MWELIFILSDECMGEHAVFACKVCYSFRYLYGLLGHVSVVYIRPTIIV